MVARVTSSAVAQSFRKDVRVTRGDASLKAFLESRNGTSNPYKLGCLLRPEFLLLRSFRISAAHCWRALYRLQVASILIRAVPHVGFLSASLFSFLLGRLNGNFRHLLGDLVSIAISRDMYKIPANIEVRPDGPDDGLTYNDG